MKYHVFFRRVSTAKQDLSMQESADAIYREKLLPEEIRIINEDATSANKKSIDKRPEMQKLISLIKNNKVDTLYAFDRTRFFRDYFEGLAFVDLCFKRDVHVIYTSQGNGNVQATNDIFLEGILAMFSDIEGKNIARRNIENQRRYPGRKFGYVKENKQYKKAPEKEGLLEEFFSSLHDISNVKELGEFLKEFRGKIKRDDESLIKIARDPFYAGYDLSKGNNKLKHVEPYLSLKNYTQIQELLDKIFNDYLGRIEDLEAKDIYTPICGYCCKTLRYSKDTINNVSFYKCTSPRSKKHPKIVIQTIDLEKMLGYVIQEIINNLDSEKLIQHSSLYLREIRKQINGEIQGIDHQLNKIREKILLNKPYSSDWKNVDPDYSKLSQLKAKQEVLLKELAKYEELFNENRNIIKTIKNILHNRSQINPSLLYKMFINSIHVYDNELKFEVCKFDYLQELQKELIYQVGDSA